MKIALIGYGKMGKAVEQIAIQRGHTCVPVSRKDTLDKASECDVAIEFTQPEAAYDNLKKLLDMGIPVASGTTGWNEKFNEVYAFAKAKKTAILIASNFSLGVNLTFAINERLAEIIKPHGYTPSITEIHHTQKLDAPSGTAISLAQQVNEHSELSDWSLDKEENKLQITAVREPDVKGTHHVYWDSAIDRITLSHEAHSRDGFALGAVIAAEFIYNKTGVYTMNDVLGL